MCGGAVLLVSPWLFASWEMWWFWTMVSVLTLSCLFCGAGLLMETVAGISIGSIRKVPPRIFGIMALCVPFLAYALIRAQYPSAPGMPARPLRLSDAGITLAHCHAAAVEQSSELFRLYDYGADARGVFRNGMLVCESIPAEDENSRFLGLLLFNRNAFEKARSEHRHYWEWRRNRNENRWRTQESGELDYDAKNLMHTFRLLYSGIHILKTGEPLVRFSGGQLRTLREIRRGVFSFEELQNQAAILVGELETLRHSSALPEEADRDAIDRLLLEITTQWENDHAE